MPRNQKETAEFVIESLNSLGLEPNPSSRLMKMYKVVTGPNTVIPYGHPDFEIAVEARRDMPVLAFILEQSHAKRHDSGLISKLSRVCYDSVLPQTDRQNSPGRDTQFELFVAAICQAEGLCPVGYEEPDIFCTMDGIRVGFAAKRVKSKSKIDKRIAEASKQIRKSGHPGFVALDTSIALNRANRWIGKAMSADKFGRKYGEAMNESLSEHENVFDRLKAQEGVVGCIFHDQQIRLDLDRVWALAGMTMIVGTASNAAEQKLFDLVSKRYRNGLPDVQHL